MAEFNGKIELDIRDSEPDWGPYAAPTAPENAPNVLYLVWDDTGIATWDCFGGLVEMPAMTPHRRSRRPTVAVPHHRPVLADQGVAADRPQRHHCRHGHHRRIHRRLPQLQRPDPVRHRAAVRGAQRARLQHLLRRQVAPDAAGRIQSGRRPSGTGRLRAASNASTDSWAARPTSGIPTWSTTTTRWTRPAHPRTATTCRKTSRTRQSNSSATPR